MILRDPDPDFLRAAVASVLAQSLQDLELVVVEDPGERSAAPVLAALGDRRIRHVVNPTRAGLAKSRNQAVNLAAAEYVAIIDGDDICLPGRMQRQADFLDAHPEVAVVGCQIEVLGADGRSRGGRAYPTDHAAIRRALRRYNPLPHPGVMFRRSAVQAVGGYRDAAPACDDYDLWSRLARAGRDFANLPEVLIRYRLHPGAMKRRQLRATLRDTLRVKREHWAGELGPGDRLRMVGERLLLCLPPALVAAVFERLTYRPLPAQPR